MTNDLINGQEVVYSSFQMDKMGLKPIGTPSFDDWLKCGDFLKNANGAVHFWIGDWMNYGERQWGEMYTQAIDETGYSYGTLANDKWVTSRIEPSRRRESLSFAHHQEIADLMPDDQEKMLSYAEKHSLNSKAFRNMVKSYKLQLDLPELSQADLNKPPSEDFKKAQEYVMMLIEVVGELESINWKTMDIDAKAFLSSQIKKSIGQMGVLISR